MHTLFNIVTTLLLLPFGTYLAKLAVKILPEKQEEMEGVLHMEFIHQWKPKEILRLVFPLLRLRVLRTNLPYDLAWQNENVEKSFVCVKDGKRELLEEVREREEYIDYLNK